MPEDIKESGLARLAGYMSGNNKNNDIDTREDRVPEKAAWLSNILSIMQPAKGTMDRSDLKAIDKHVGSKIKVARLLRGCSLQEIAGCTRISYQQLQKYEKATNRISASRLYQIASILEFPPSYFFDGLSFTATDSRPPFQEDQVEVLRCYGALPDESKEDILALMKIMAARRGMCRQ